MTKTSKKLVIIIIILLVATFGLFYNKISITSFLTDSGFDSSYDSGGSWGGGSSWDSGSSYDSGGSYSSDGSSSGGAVEFIVIFIIVLAYIILKMTEDTADGGRASNMPPLKLIKSKAWNSEKFATMIKDITLEKFLFERVADLVQVQYNWMNFDYDKLREKLTDELYNQYEMQLKTLQNKGQRNVMKNFNTIDSMVTNVENDNGRYTVTMEVIISFIDYIEQNGKAVRGKKNKPITMHYELVYTSSSNGIVSKCPKCGGELSDTTSQVCPYCRTQIVQDSTKWVMSKKIAKGQR